MRSRFHNTLAVLAAFNAFAGVALAEPPAAEKPADKAAQPAAPARPAPTRIEMAPKGEFPETMTVPPEAASLGTVYQTISGRARQLLWMSDAPAEKIDGVSNNIVGYAVAGDGEEPGKLKAAEWSLPVKSMRTGNPTRDGHMAGAEWLDADKHSSVTFKLKRVDDVRKPAVAANAKVDPNLKSYVATLVGDLTIKGVTKEVSFTDTQIKFRPAQAIGSEMIGKGDLLFLSSKFSVKLADYGIAHEVISVKQKVAEKLDLTVNLICSTGGAADAAEKPAAKPEGRSVGS